VPLAERELDAASIASRRTGTSHAGRTASIRTGLAFSPDERTLYVANTRWTAYIHAIELDAARQMIGGASSPTCRPTRPTACPTA
jgi:sugar lactone lactonase YvrE